MRRFWLILIVVAVVLGGIYWLAGPHLWAWYHFNAGQSALERYHAEDALSHLEACLDVWPSSATAHLLACRAARQTGDFARAKQHLDECQRLEVDPSSASLLEFELLKVSGGKLDLEGRLESLADTDPALAPLIWEALAEGYLRVYRIRDALTCLDKWLRFQPDNVQALFLQGNIWRQVRSHGRAVSSYRRVVELDPQRLDARQYLAFCLMEDGQYDEAITQLNTLRRQRPDDPDVLARLARCQSKRRQLDAARKVLAEVLEKHPDHALSLRTRGQLALMEREPAEAEHWLRKAVHLWPYDYESQYALFLALTQQGKKAAAQEQSKTTEALKKRQERIGAIKSHDMSLRPRDPALHCELGTLLIEVGHAEVGLGWLESALQLDPNYGPAHAALARHYADHGDAAKAAFHRKEAQTAQSGTP
jgi:tetratricopeptide (TPR) repeat protein